MSSSIQHANDQTFESVVRNRTSLVLVDFFADWCGPCKAQEPILHAFAEAHREDVAVVKVNVDDAANTAHQYGIRSIPTLALFDDGELIATLTGIQPQERLHALIQQH